MASDPLLEFNTQQQRFFWRNYTAHIVEGGLYMGGLAFISLETILPVIVRNLGGPNWLIALMPILMTLGFMVAPLLTVHWVERMPWMKPYVLSIGFFQRMPFIAAALALFFLSESHPVLTLTLVALAPFVSGFCGGLCIGAYMEMVSRIIPPHRLSSGWALRFIIAGMVGILAGDIVKQVLAEHPGATGYGILHLITTGFLYLSMAVFFMIREVFPPPRRESRAPRTLAGTLRGIPEILRHDRPYRLYLAVRVATTGVYVLLPFLSIHVLETTGKDSSFLGILVTLQMVGGILGNLIAGYLGDRIGGRLPVLLSFLAYIALAAIVPFVTQVWVFGALYFLFGMAFFMNGVGTATLNIELSPADRRPTYVALASLTAAPSLVLAASLSGILRNHTHSILPPAVLCLLSCLLGLWAIIRLPEPRVQPVRGAR